MPTKHPKWGTPLFWFLCKKHLTGVYDAKRDLKGSMFKQDRNEICDYPWPYRCKLKATNEYFPCLVKRLKQAKKSPRRIRMLHELSEFTTKEEGQ